MSLRKAGYIVGEVETNSIEFLTDLNNFPPRHEYLVIPKVKERVGDEFIEVDVLAQVTRISNFSEVLGQFLSVEELETIMSKYRVETKVFGKANILGYLDKYGNVLYPRSAAKPGQEVYIAHSTLLEKFFSKNVELGIPIGSLITRSDVSVKIDPNGFRKHIAVIAQTGAGKSYLVGLILEKLLPLGATIIVFDPNSDYVMMRKNGDGDPTENAENIVIYRPPGVRGRRFTDEDIGGAEEYTIDFSSLTADEIAEVAGISERWAVIREALTQTLSTLEGIYYPQQLLDELHTLSDSPNRRIAGGAERAITYIQRLARYGIWGNADIPLEAIIRPKRLSIIDLASLQRKVSEYIVEKTLSELWNRAVTGDLDYPIFVVLEEAHNFASQARGGSVRFTIDQIASEGRKFKIFLLVVTQRPKKISENVLSQCNSQIIMRLTNPEDMRAVRNSSERLSEDLFNDLPGLNRGEAVVVGPLIKVPTMVKISGRDSAEGGSDIDVVESLKRAQKIYELQKHSQLSSERDKEPRSKW